MTKGKPKQEYHGVCPWCKKKIHYKYFETTVEPATLAVKEQHYFIEKDLQKKLDVSEAKA